MNLMTYLATADSEFGRILVEFSGEPIITAVSILTIVASFITFLAIKDDN